MHPIIPIAATFFGVAGFMKFRKKKCSSCRRNVRVAGMVGACCKACAEDHGKCESEMTEEELAAYHAKVAGQRNRHLGRKRRF